MISHTIPNCAICIEAMSTEIHLQFIDMLPKCWIPSRRSFLSRMASAEALSLQPAGKEENIQVVG